MSHNHCTFAIGIDIGGTTSRAALVNNLGLVVSSMRRSTPNQYDELLRWIATTANDWARPFGSPTNTSIGIGVALPGVVDPVAGSLIRSVNLPWLEGRPIVDQLELEIGHRPVLMTDAEAATWGEYIALGSPPAPFAHLRLGTGVACGIVVSEKLIPTDSTRRTHLPLLIVDDSADAPHCPCGLRGCLEVFAGGNSLARKARDLGLHDMADLHRACESGHEAAIATIDQAAIAITRAIEGLAAEFAVTAVVLGGGVGEAIPSLFPRMKEAVAKSTHPEVRVHASRLGDDAGTIGAARSAFRLNLIVGGATY